MDAGGVIVKSGGLHLQVKGFMVWLYLFPN